MPILKASKSSRSLSFSFALLLVLWGGIALAAPQGGRIESGAGDVTSDPLNIRQDSQELRTSWDSFNISSGEVVTIHQPNAHALINIKVRNGSGTNIDGGLNANGKVQLENPAGITFGAGSVVNVGGLLASASAGAVKANGVITAPLGEVHLQSLANNNVVNVGGAVEAQRIIVEGAGEVKLDSTARLTASKEVLVGGGFQGKGEIANSQKTIVESGALITSPRVIIWSDVSTNFQGSIKARDENGEGGFVEVSGKQHLASFDILKIESAELLLDPDRVRISTNAQHNPEVSDGSIAAGDTRNAHLGATNSLGARITFYDITPAAIEGYVGNVTLSARELIGVSVAINKTNGGLTLNAPNILFYESVRVSGDLTVNASTTINFINSSGASMITLSGANVSLTSPSTPSPYNVNFTITARGNLTLQGNFNIGTGTMRLTAGEGTGTGMIIFSKTANVKPTLAADVIILTQDGAPFSSTAPATFTIPNSGKPQVNYTGGTQTAHGWLVLNPPPFNAGAADINIMDLIANNSNEAGGAFRGFPIINGLLDFGSRDISLTTTGNIIFPTGITEIRASSLTLTAANIGTSTGTSATGAFTADLKIKVAKNLALSASLTSTAALTLEGETLTIRGNTVLTAAAITITMTSTRDNEAAAIHNVDNQSLTLMATAGNLTLATDNINLNYANSNTGLGNLTLSASGEILFPQRTTVRANNITLGGVIKAESTSGGITTQQFLTLTVRGQLSFATDKPTTITGRGITLTSPTAQTWASGEGQDLTIIANNRLSLTGNFNVGGGTIRLTSLANSGRIRFAFNETTLTASAIFLMQDGAVFPSTAPATFQNAAGATIKPQVRYTGSQTQAAHDWFVFAPLSFDAGADNIDIATLIDDNSILAGGVFRESSIINGLLDFGDEEVILTTTGNIIFPAGITEIRAGRLELTAAKIGTGTNGAGAFTADLKIVVGDVLDLSAELTSTHALTLESNLIRIRKGGDVTLTAAAINITMRGRDGVTTIENGDDESLTLKATSGNITLDLATNITLLGDDGGANLTLSASGEILFPQATIINANNITLGGVIKVESTDTATSATTQHNLQLNVRGQLIFATDKPTTITGAALLLNSTTAQTTASDKDLTITATGNLTLVNGFNIGTGTMRLTAGAGAGEGTIMSTNATLTAGAIFLTQDGALFAEEAPATFIIPNSGKPIANYIGSETQTTHDWFFPYNPSFDAGADNIDIAALIADNSILAGGGAFRRFSINGGLLDFGDAEVILTTTGNIIFPAGITEIRAGRLELTAANIGTDDSSGNFTADLKIAVGDILALSGELTSTHALTLEVALFRVRNSDTTLTAAAITIATRGREGVNLAAIANNNNQSLTLKATSGNITIAAYTTNLTYNSSGTSGSNITLSASGEILFTDTTFIFARNITLGGRIKTEATNEASPPVTTQHNLTLDVTGQINFATDKPTTITGAVIVLHSPTAQTWASGEGQDLTITATGSLTLRGSFNIGTGAMRLTAGEGEDTTGTISFINSPSLTASAIFLTQDGALFVEEKPATFIIPNSGKPQVRYTGSGTQTAHRWFIFIPISFDAGADDIDIAALIADNSILAGGAFRGFAIDNDGLLAFGEEDIILTTTGNIIFPAGITEIRARRLELTAANIGTDDSSGNFIADLKIAVGDILALSGELTSTHALTLEGNLFRVRNSDTTLTAAAINITMRGREGVAAIANVDNQSLTLKATSGNITFASSSTNLIYANSNTGLGNLTLSASGEILFSQRTHIHANNITLGGVIKVEATREESDGSTTITSRRLTLNATGQINFATDKPTTITAANITLNSPTAQTRQSGEGQDLTITATGNLTLRGSFNTGTGDITVTTGAGHPINFSTTQATTLTGRNITLTSTGGTPTPSNQDLTLTATGAVTLAGNFNVGSGTMRLTAGSGTGTGTISFISRPNLTAGAVILTQDGAFFPSTDPANFILPSGRPQANYTGSGTQTPHVWFVFPSLSFDASDDNINIMTLIAGGYSEANDIFAHFSINGSGLLDFGEAEIALTTTGNIIFPAGITEIRAGRLELTAANIGTGTDGTSAFTADLKIAVGDILALSGELTSTHALTLEGNLFRVRNSDTTLTAAAINIKMRGRARSALAAIANKDNQSLTLKATSGNITLDLATTINLNHANSRTGLGNLTLSASGEILFPQATTINVRNITLGGRIKTEATNEASPPVTTQHNLTLDVTGQINFATDKPTTITGAVIVLHSTNAQTWASGEGQDLTITATGSLTLRGSFNIGTGSLILEAASFPTTLTNFARGGTSFIYTGETNPAFIIPAWAIADGKHLSVRATKANIMVPTSIPLGTGNLTLNAEVGALLLSGDTTISANNITLLSKNAATIRNLALTLTATGAVTLGGNFNTGTSPMTITSGVGQPINFSTTQATTLRGGDITLASPTAQTRAGGEGQDLTLASSGTLSITGVFNLGEGSLIMEGLSFNQATYDLFTRGGSGFIYTGESGGLSIPSWAIADGKDLFVRATKTYINVPTTSLSLGEGNLTLSTDVHLLFFDRTAPTTISANNITLISTEPFNASDQALTLIAMGAVTLGGSFNTGTGDISVTSGVGQPINFSRSMATTLRGGDIRLASTGGTPTASGQDLTLASSGTISITGEPNLGRGTLIMEGVTFDETDFDIIGNKGGVGFIYTGAENFEIPSWAIANGRNLFVRATNNNGVNIIVPPTALSLGTGNLTLNAERGELVFSAPTTISANNITLLSQSTATTNNQALTLTATGAVTLGGRFNTGTANITITSGTDQPINFSTAFTTALTGANITLTSTGGTPTPSNQTLVLTAANKIELGGAFNTGFLGLNSIVLELTRDTTLTATSMEIRVTGSGTAGNSAIRNVDNQSLTLTATSGDIRFFTKRINLRHFNSNGGEGNLTLSASGEITFSQKLIIAANNITLGGVITTTVSQTPIIIRATRQLNFATDKPTTIRGSITLESGVQGIASNQDLTLLPSGTISINGAFNLGTGSLFIEGFNFNQADYDKFTRGGSGFIYTGAANFFIPGWVNADGKDLSVTAIKADILVSPLSLGTGNLTLNAEVGALIFNSTAPTTISANNITLISAAQATAQRLTVLATGAVTLGGMFNTGVAISVTSGVGQPINFSTTQATTLIGWAITLTSTGGTPTPSNQALTLTATGRLTMTGAFNLGSGTLTATGAAIVGGNDNLILNAATIIFPQETSIIANDLTIGGVIKAESTSGGTTTQHNLTLNATGQLNFATNRDTTITGGAITLLSAGDTPTLSNRNLTITATGAVTLGGTFDVTGRWSRFITITSGAGYPINFSTTQATTLIGWAITLTSSGGTPTPSNQPLTATGAVTLGGNFNTGTGAIAATRGVSFSTTLATTLMGREITLTGRLTPSNQDLTITATGAVTLAGGFNAGTGNILITSGTDQPINFSTTQATTFIGGNITFTFPTTQATANNIASNQDLTITASGDLTLEGNFNAGDGIMRLTAGEGEDTIGTIIFNKTTTSSSEEILPALTAGRIILTQDEVFFPSTAQATFTLPDNDNKPRTRYFGTESQPQYDWFVSTLTFDAGRDDIDITELIANDSQLADGKFADFSVGQNGLLDFGDLEITFITQGNIIFPPSITKISARSLTLNTMYGGTTTLSQNITTSVDLILGRINLSGDGPLTFSSANVRLENRVRGNQDLTIIATNRLTMGGNSDIRLGGGNLVVTAPSIAVTNTISANNITLTATSTTQGDTPESAGLRGGVGLYATGDIIIAASHINLYGLGLSARGEIIFPQNTEILTQGLAIGGVIKVQSIDRTTQYDLMLTITEYIGFSGPSTSRIRFTHSNRATTISGANITLISGTQGGGYTTQDLTITATGDIRLQGDFYTSGGRIKLLAGSGAGEGTIIFTDARLSAGAIILVQDGGVFPSTAQATFILPDEGKPQVDYSGSETQELHDWFVFALPTFNAGGADINIMALIADGSTLAGGAFAHFFIDNDGLLDFGNKDITLITEGDIIFPADIKKIKAESLTLFAAAIITDDSSRNFIADLEIDVDISLNLPALTLTSTGMLTLEGEIFNLRGDSNLKVDDLTITYSGTGSFRYDRWMAGVGRNLTLIAENGFVYVGDDVNTQYYFGLVVINDINLGDDTDDSILRGNLTIKAREINFDYSHTIKANNIRLITGLENSGIRSSAGRLTLDATGDITISASDIVFENDYFIFTSEHLVFVAGGEIVFTRDTNIEANSIALGGTIRAESTDGNGITTLHNLRFKINTYEELVGGVTEQIIFANDKPTTITAANITLTSFTAQATASNQDLTLKSSGTISITGAFDIGEGNLILEAVSFPATLTNVARGDTGFIYIGQGNFANVARGDTSLIYVGEDDFTIPSWAIATGKNLSVTATQGNINVPRNEFIGGFSGNSRVFGLSLGEGNLTLNAEKGALLLSGNTTLEANNITLISTQAQTTTQPLTVLATGGVTLGGMFNTGTAAISVTSGVGQPINFSTTQATTLIGWAITLTSTGGTPTPSNQALTLTPSREVTLGGNFNTGTGDVLIVGDVYFSSNQATTLTGGDITLTSTSGGGRISRQDLTITASGNLTLQGSFNIGNDASTGTGGTMMLTAGEGDSTAGTIIFTNAALTAKGISLTQDGAFFAEEAPATFAIIDNGKPVVRYTGSGTQTTHDWFISNLTFDAGDDDINIMTLIAEGSTLAEGVFADFSINQEGLLDFGNLDIALITEGNIIFPAGITEIRAHSLTLTAANIGMGDGTAAFAGDLKIQVVRNLLLSADLTSTGALTLEGITLTTAGDSTLTAATVNINQSITARGDLIIIATTNAINFSAVRNLRLTGTNITLNSSNGTPRPSDRNLFIAARGNLTLEGSFDAGTHGRIQLTAGGSADTTGIITFINASFTARRIWLRQDGAFFPEEAPATFTLTNNKDKPVAYYIGSETQTQHDWFATGFRGGNNFGDADINIMALIATGFAIGDGAITFLSINDEGILDLGDVTTFITTGNIIFPASITEIRGGNLILAAAALITDDSSGDFISDLKISSGYDEFYLSVGSLTSTATLTLEGYFLWITGDTSLTAAAINITGKSTDVNFPAIRNTDNQSLTLKATDGDITFFAANIDLNHANSRMGAGNLTLSASGEIIFTQATTIINAQNITLGGVVKAESTNEEVINGETIDVITQHNLTLTATGQIIFATDTTTISGADITLASPTAQTWASGEGQDLTLKSSGRISITGAFDIGEGSLTLEGTSFPDSFTNVTRGGTGFIYIGEDDFTIPSWAIIADKNLSVTATQGNINVPINEFIGGVFGNSRVFGLSLGEGNLTLNAEKGALILSGNTTLEANNITLISAQAQTTTQPLTVLATGAVTLGGMFNTGTGNIRITSGAGHPINFSTTQATTLIGRSIGLISTGGTPAPSNQALTITASLFGVLLGGKFNTGTGDILITSGANGAIGFSTTQATTLTGGNINLTSGITPTASGQDLTITASDNITLEGSFNVGNNNVRGNDGILTTSGTIRLTAGSGAGTGTIIFPGDVTTLTAGAIILTQDGAFFAEEAPATFALPDSSKPQVFYAGSGTQTAHDWFIFAVPTFNAGAADINIMLLIADNSQLAGGNFAQFSINQEGLLDFGDLDIVLITEGNIIFPAGITEIRAGSLTLTAANIGTGDGTAAFTDDLKIQVVRNSALSADLTSTGALTLEGITLTTAGDSTLTAATVNINQNITARGDLIIIATTNAINFSAVRNIKLTGENITLNSSNGTPRPSDRNLFIAARGNLTLEGSFDAGTHGRIQLTAGDSAGTGIITFINASFAARRIWLRQDGAFFPEEAPATFTLTNNKDKPVAYYIGSETQTQHDWFATYFRGNHDFGDADINIMALIATGFVVGDGTIAFGFINDEGILGLGDANTFITTGNIIFPAGITEIRGYDLSLTAAALITDDSSGNFISDLKINGGNDFYLSVGSLTSTATLTLEGDLLIRGDTSITAAAINIMSTIPDLINFPAIRNTDNQSLTLKATSGNITFFAANIDLNHANSRTGKGNLTLSASGEIIFTQATTIINAQNITLGGVIKAESTIEVTAGDPPTTTLTTTQRNLTLTATGQIIFATDTTTISGADITLASPTAQTRQSGEGKDLTLKSSGVLSITGAFDIGEGDLTLEAASFPATLTNFTHDDTSLIYIGEDDFTIPSWAIAVDKDLSVRATKANIFVPRNEFLGGVSGDSRLFGLSLGEGALILNAEKGALLFSGDTTLEVKNITLISTAQGTAGGSSLIITATGAVTLGGMFNRGRGGINITSGAGHPINFSTTQATTLMGGGITLTSSGGTPIATNQALTITASFSIMLGGKFNTGTGDILITSGTDGAINFSTTQATTLRGRGITLISPAARRTGASNKDLTLTALGNLTLEGSFDIGNDATTGGIMRLTAGEGAGTGSITFTNATLTAKAMFLTQDGDAFDETAPATFTLPSGVKPQVDYTGSAGTEYKSPSWAECASGASDCITILAVPDDGINVTQDDDINLADAVSPFDFSVDEAGLLDLGGVSLTLITKGNIIFPAGITRINAGSLTLTAANIGVGDGTGSLTANLLIDIEDVLSLSIGTLTSTAALTLKGIAFELTGDTNLTAAAINITMTSTGTGANAAIRTGRVRNERVLFTLGLTATSENIMLAAANIDFFERRSRNRLLGSLTLLASGSNGEILFPQNIDIYLVNLTLSGVVKAQSSDFVTDYNLLISANGFINFATDKATTITAADINLFACEGANTKDQDLTLTASGEVTLQNLFDAGTGDIVIEGQSIKFLSAFLWGKDITLNATGSGTPSEAGRFLELKPSGTLSITGAFNLGTGDLRVEDDSFNKVDFDKFTRGGTRFIYTGETDFIIPDWAIVEDKNLWVEATRANVIMPTSILLGTGNLTVFAERGHALIFDADEPTTLSAMNVFFISRRAQTTASDQKLTITATGTLTLFGGYYNIGEGAVFLSFNKFSSAPGGIFTNDLTLTYTAASDDSNALAYKDWMDGAGRNLTLISKNNPITISEDVNLGDGNLTLETPDVVFANNPTITAGNILFDVAQFTTEATLALTLDVDDEIVFAQDTILQVQNITLGGVVKAESTEEQEINGETVDVTTQHDLTLTASGQIIFATDKPTTISAADITLTSPTAQTRANGEGQDLTLLPSGTLSITGAFNLGTGNLILEGTSFPATLTNFTRGGTSFIYIGEANTNFAIPKLGNCC